MELTSLPFAWTQKTAPPPPPAAFQVGEMTPELSSDLRDLEVPSALQFCSTDLNFLSKRLQPAPSPRQLDAPVTPALSCSVLPMSCPSLQNPPSGLFCPHSQNLGPGRNPLSPRPCTSLLVGLPAPRISPRTIVLHTAARMIFLKWSCHSSS